MKNRITAPESAVTRTRSPAPRQLQLRVRRRRPRPDRQPELQGSRPAIYRLVGRLPKMPGLPLARTRQESLGPSLAGIVGKKAASDPTYNYSVRSVAPM